LGRRSDGEKTSAVQARATSPFIDALTRTDLDAIRRCPKADLHNHAYLGGCRNYLLERTGHDIAPLAHKLRSMDEMHAWVAAHIKPLLKGGKGRRLAYEAALVLARDDGVTRIEFGDDVSAIAGGLASAAELTQSVREMLGATAPEIEWIPLVGMMRDTSVAELTRLLDPFLELGCYRTLDLYGDEASQPIENFRAIYRRAKARGLRLKAHVGEWGTADDVWRAVEVLELDEVQHGIAAATSPAIMRKLARHRIRLNVCPTSNVLLGRVESIATHPIRELYDAGVKVTVNTDDALVFGRSVSEEFLGLYRAGVFTATELDIIRLNGLND
jgi:adenosine deaminase